MRAGVRQGGRRIYWHDSRCSVSKRGERFVSVRMLPSDESELVFGFLWASQEVGLGEEFVVLLKEPLFT